MKIKIDHSFQDEQSKAYMCGDCFIKIDGNQDKATMETAKNKGDIRAIHWMDKFTANFNDTIKKDSEIKCMCGKTLFKVSF